MNQIKEWASIFLSGNQSRERSSESLSLATCLKKLSRLGKNYIEHGSVEKSEQRLRAWGQEFLSIYAVANQSQKELAYATLLEQDELQLLHILEAFYAIREEEINLPLVDEIFQQIAVCSLAEKEKYKGFRQLIKISQLRTIWNLEC